MRLKGEVEVMVVRYVVLSRVWVMVADLGVGWEKVVVWRAVWL